MTYAVDLVWLFFAYSFLGWCIEVALKYRQFHRFINRGFFTGPILPIYGSGAALITLVVGNLSRFESGYGTTFALSFLICGLVEYLTSYIMEKRFHARWWDYSGKPMNLHGRVWIGNLVLFGLGGVAIIHIIDPLLCRGLDALPLSVKEMGACALLAIFAADYVLTHFMLKLVKVGVESSQADNTEEISREIYLLLSDRSVLYKRFVDAYPEVIYRTERINARLAAVKAETERLRQEAEQRLAERKEQLSATLEPSAMIAGALLAKQDALIDLLYDEDTATPEMRALKADIRRDRDRLKARPITRLVPVGKGE